MNNRPGHSQKVAQALVLFNTTLRVYSENLNGDPGTHRSQRSDHVSLFTFDVSRLMTTSFLHTPPALNDKYYAVSTRSAYNENHICAGARYHSKNYRRFSDEGYQ